MSINKPSCAADSSADNPEAPAPSAGPPGFSRFPTVIHRLAVGSRTIDLLSPRDPDALLDDPEIEARYKADNYLPYWPIIWPAGILLAEKILQGDHSPPAPPADATGPAVIELGCGLGLAGIAAGLRGWSVTFTDYDPEAAEFARYNARLNGMDAHYIRALRMDWRMPLLERFPWVIASDVLYERRLHAPLLDAVENLLARGGQAWVSDPNRTSAEDFPVAAAARGFRVATVALEGTSPLQSPQPATLYVLTWPGSK